MSRLLIDESSGKRLANLLRTDHDVIYVGDIMPSSPDLEVLKFAEKDTRILITDDKDFGELIFRLGKTSKGVILLRMNTTDPERRFKALTALLKSIDGIDKKFIVLEETVARIRTVNP